MLLAPGVEYSQTGSENEKTNKQKTPEIWRLKFVAASTAALIQGKQEVVNTFFSTPTFQAFSS